MGKLLADDKSQSGFTNLIARLVQRHPQCRLGDLLPTGHLKRTYLPDVDAREIGAPDIVAVPGESASPGSMTFGRGQPIRFGKMRPGLEVGASMPGRTRHFAPKTGDVNRGVLVAVAARSLPDADTGQSHGAAAVR